MKIVNRSVDVRMAVNVHTSMEYVTACPVGLETSVKILALTQLGETTANIHANVLMEHAADCQMDFVSANLDSWVRSAKKFVLKVSLVRTVLRFVNVIVNQTSSAIQLMAVSAKSATKVAIVTSQ